MKYHFLLYSYEAILCYARSLKVISGIETPLGWLVGGNFGLSSTFASSLHNGAYGTVNWKFYGVITLTMERWLDGVLPESTIDSARASDYCSEVTLGRIRFTGVRHAGVG